MLPFIKIITIDNHLLPALKSLKTRSPTNKFCNFLQLVVYIDYLFIIYLALSNMDRGTATAKANYCGPEIYGIYAQRLDHNTTSPTLCKQ